MTKSNDTYSTVTPYLIVPDADAELAFLKAAFGGVEASCHRNADNTVGHAEVRLGDSLVMLGQSGGQWKPLSGAIYLWVDDVDATYSKALEAGGRRRGRPRTCRTAIATQGSSIRTGSPGGSPRP